MVDVLLLLLKMFFFYPVSIKICWVVARLSCMYSPPAMFSNHIDSKGEIFLLKKKNSALNKKAFNKFFFLIT